MSKPQQKELSMFYTEGNPAASLVTRSGKRMKETAMRFDTPELALAWCRKHRSRFIYMPAPAALN